MVVRRCDVTDAAALQHLSHEAMGYDFPLSDTTAKLTKLLNDSTNLILSQNLMVRSSAISMQLIMTCCMHRIIRISWASQCCPNTGVRV